MRKSSTILIVGVIIAIAVVVTILVAGKKDKTTNTTNTNTSQSTNNSTNVNASTGTAVSISGMAFSPQTLTVKMGSTVTWTNMDSTTHTVTKDSSDGPDSGNLAKDGTYQFTFNAAGTFKYHCSLHSYMTGTVVVTP